MKNKRTNSTPQKPLTPAMEDYLEAIYNLGREKRAIRVKDIAKRLDVKMPTVTSMLNTLGDRGFVDYQKYEYIELTKKGHRVGKEINRRHKVLLGFFQSCPRAGSSWLDNFEEYRLHGRDPNKCVERMKEFSNGFRHRMKTISDVKEKDGDVANPHRPKSRGR
jgi:DtxR family Mn-dependent transcriptional regulator